MTTDRSEQSGPMPADEVLLPPLPTCWTGSPVTVTWAEDGEQTTRKVYTADQMHTYAQATVATLLAERASHQQAVEALRAEVERQRLVGFQLLDAAKLTVARLQSAEARLARVAGVLADLHGRLTPSADFLADQIAAAIAPQEGE